MNEVTHLLRKDIDEKKWNNCVKNAVNGLPYAYTWYLDSVAKNWGGLILNDYEAVMPCPWYKSGPFSVLYQPHYCQQGGVFAQYEITPQLYINFLRCAQKNYTLRYLQINPEVGAVKSTFKMYARTNLVLSLLPTYLELKKKFAANHIRNINKAKKAGLYFDEWNDLASFQAFYKANVNLKKEPLTLGHFAGFNSLTEKLTSVGNATIYAAFDKTHQAMAAVLLIPHQNRLIALVNTSSENGKKTGASHFLYAALLEKFAQTNHIFDFEGSSVPTIARFYEGFGAVNQPFYVWEPGLMLHLKRALR